MPLDTRIPLSAVQPRRSPLETYGQALQLKSAQKQMQAQDIALQRDTDKRNLLKTAVDPTTGALDYSKVESGLIGSGDLEGALGVRKMAADERRLDMQSKADKAKQAIATIDAESRLLGGVTDEASYQAARQRGQAMGLAETWPEMYDPTLVQSALQAGLDAKSRLQMDFDKTKFAETQRHNKIVEGQGTERNSIARNKSEPMVEVYDANSPTGTSYVPRSQAAGRAGKPPSNGITVTTDENGNPVVQVGGQGGGAKPTSAVNTETQKDVIGAIGTLDRLDEIAKSYSSDYLTYGGRAQAGIASIADKAGMASKNQKDFVAGRRKFTQQVDQEFNAYRKDITGAAAAMSELESLKKAMINTDLGPAEFESAYRTYRDSVSRMLRLKQSILREGVPLGSRQFNKRLDDAWVGGGDDSADARGAELEASGMPEAQVVQQLKREGYTR